MVHLSTDAPAEITLDFAGSMPVGVSGRVLRGRVCAHNTFEKPDNVAIEAMRSIGLENGDVVVTLPPCGIAAIEVEFE